MLVVCLCHITLIYLLDYGLPLLELCLDVMINVKYNTFSTTIISENINNDTLTLRVKCYNGISVHLRILL